VKCELETGRTHQIRVHLAYIKHPVYGDNIYGSHVDDFNQRLHAYRLSFIHPISKKQVDVYSDIPSEFDIAEYDYELLKNDN
jgi:23S rRNA pseudouridine1911/1915/1917 synthase